MKKIVFVLLSIIILQNLSFANRQHVHQRLVIEGYKLLKMWLGNNPIPIMDNKIGDYSNIGVNPFGNSIETLNTINLQDTLTQNRYSFEPLIGFGIPPFKILAGAGYYINDKFEVTIKYTGMFLPNSFDIDVISTGIRMHENIASGTIYFFDLGAVMNKKTGISQSKINGAYFEGGLGYMFKTNVGFSNSLNFRIGEIVRSGENPLLVVGVDLIIGWLIKI